MNREKAEKKNQAQEILEAAFRCISRKGYANVSLREIADEAGVVLSQLNYYYTNKEGLFTEVIRMMVQKYLVEVECFLRQGETPREKITALIKFFKEMLKNNPELFRLLYDFTGLALWSTAFSELLRKLFKDLANLIEKYTFTTASLKEPLKGYSPQSLARMILGAMFGTAIQVILDPDEKNLSDALNAIQTVFE